MCSSMDVVFCFVLLTLDICQFSCPWPRFCIRSKEVSFVVVILSALEDARQQYTIGLVQGAFKLKLEVSSFKFSKSR